MEFVASLPPDLAAIANPTASGPAPPLRPTDKDDAAAAASMPFEFLLGLLTAPLPGGESLPAAGNGLPATTGTAIPAATSASGTPAKPVTVATLLGAGSADLFARLKLSAAPAPAATEQASALAAQPTDAANATAQQLADLDLPSTPDVAATQPAAAAPATPAAAAEATPSPELAAALKAALSEPAARDSTAKSPRTSQKGTVDQVSAAADLRAAQTSASTAPMPVADVADSATRPAHRDAAVDAFALPVTVSSVDTTAPMATTPALAPALSHSTTAATPADASALAGQAGAIDTRADNWHEALASRVQVLVDQHLGEAHIKLNPPELGAVDIKVSLVDDKTFVQLTAGTSAARDELTQSLPRLRELLLAGGLSLGGASVHGGNAGQTGHDPAPRPAMSSAYSPFAAPDDDLIAPVRMTPRAAGSIDLFA